MGRGVGGKRQKRVGRVEGGEEETEACGKGEDGEEDRETCEAGGGRRTRKSVWRGKGKKQTEKRVAGRSMHLQYFYTPQVHTAGRKM